MKTTARVARFLGIAASVTVLFQAQGGARAQSLNVDFGQPANKPSDTYAAAGLPGVWNSIQGAAGPTYNLVGLDGRPTSVTLSQSGSTSLLSASDPSVTGDDAALLNDALITNIAGQETCLFVHGLEPGMYEVLVYAWMPNAPAVKSRVRHDLSTMTQDIGGAWTGAHVQGVTYSRHILTIGSDGFMGSHSGVVPGAVAANGAALNGFQIRKIVTTLDGGAAPDAATASDAGVGPGSDAAASGSEAGTTGPVVDASASDAPSGQNPDAARPVDPSGTAAGSSGCSSTGDGAGPGAGSLSLAALVFVSVAGITAARRLARRAERARTSRRARRR
jgi:hypothetical protein